MLSRDFSSDGYDSQNPPIVKQPGPNDSMHNDRKMYPRSFDYLNKANEIFVQKFGNDYTCTDRTDYSITNADGETLYTGSETSNYFQKKCFKSQRTLDIKIYDSYKEQIIQIDRACGCSGCCFPCCIDHVSVTSPSGDVFGTINEEWLLYTLSLVIKDGQQNTLFRIYRNSFSELKCCGRPDICFKILSSDGKTEIGEIIKIFDITNFNPIYKIIFPEGCNLNMKIMMFATTFFLHFRYFEWTRRGFL